MSASASARGSTAAGRILLAEDDTLLRSAFARALKSAGHQVTAVADGAAAAELIRTQTFDAVVSDIQMPRMNGMQLLRLIREYDLDVPVLLVTATPSIDTAAEAVEQGAFCYLVKPFELAELLQKVHRALGLHQLAKLKRQALESSTRDSRLVGDRVGLEVRFQHALDGIWMAYQPIVSWSGHNVFGYEALMRTTESTMPTPEALLSAAERLGSLHQLGRRIRSAIAPATTLVGEAALFVNLHVTDLTDETLYDLAGPLSAAARHIVLEITERASLDEVPHSRACAGRLRALGFRIALDDLGAGYAGLSSFAHLEPDFAKLDMSLVRNIHAEPTRRTLVRSMVSACRELGIGLIAEGIEIPEERDALLDSGVDLLQGFLFGRPEREMRAPAF